MEEHTNELRILAGMSPKIKGPWITMLMNWKRQATTFQANSECSESLNRIFSDSNSEHDDGLATRHNANRKLSETHDRSILQKAERRPLIKWPKMTNTCDLRE